MQALQITLMGGPLTRREGGTQNLEAYQLYLRALAWTAQAANTIDLAWARALPWDEAFERGRLLERGRYDELRAMLEKHGRQINSLIKPYSARASLNGEQSAAPDPGVSVPVPEAVSPRALPRDHPARGRRCHASACSCPHVGTVRQERDMRPASHGALPNLPS